MRVDDFPCVVDFPEYAGYGVICHKDHVSVLERCPDVAGPGNNGNMGIEHVYPLLKGVYGLSFQGIVIGRAKPFEFSMAAHSSLAADMCKFRAILIIAQELPDVGLRRMPRQSIVSDLYFVDNFIVCGINHGRQCRSMYVNVTKDLPRRPRLSEKRGYTGRPGEFLSELHFQEA